MPEYKRQHYLPTTYLKHFSSDQANCNKEGFTWRCDRNTMRHVAVVSQCSGNYHYSKNDPAGAEKTFHGIEQRYSKSMARLRQGLAITTEDYGHILVAMFDFYIRNAVHTNETGKEEIEAYKIRSALFLKDIIFGGKAEFSKEQLERHIERNWGAQIINAPPQRLFLTSDHPSAWTSINDSQPGLHLITMPLTPFHTAVAFDKRLVEVAGNQATQDDYVTLNDAQMQNADECVYSSIPFTQDQINSLRAYLPNRGEIHSTVSGTKWNLRIV